MYKIIFACFLIFFEGADLLLGQDNSGALLTRIVPGNGERFPIRRNFSNTQEHIPEPFMNLGQWFKNDLTLENSGIFLPEIRILPDSVQTAWTTHFASGSAPGFDKAVKVAADANSNVYVTGYSSTPDYGLDYLTVKYDSSGNLLWSRRFSAPETGDDFPVDMSLGTDNRLYVTGMSWRGNDRYDIITICYDPQGVEQWRARYGSFPANDDYVTAMALDGANSVLLCGWNTGNNNTADYLVLKYDNQGVEQWVSGYDGAGSSDRAVDLAVDRGDNVIVTGLSYDRQTQYDFATIKYDSQGRRQWVNRFNGPDNLRDQPAAVAVDAGGNSCVTGYSETVGSGQDYVTVKYGPGGTERWVRSYNGTADGRDFATAITVDDSGLFYVAGASETANSGFDFLTLKYDTAGAEIWQADYDDPAHGDDQPVGVQVDVAGNVFVSGLAKSANLAEVATVSYNSGGNLEWSAVYNSPGGVVPANLALDADANVQVTGYSGSFPDYDFSIIRYDEHGNLDWARGLDGPGNSIDEAEAVIGDNLGNLYIAGNSYNSVGANNYTTVKFTPGGNREWVRHYDGPGQGVDKITAMTVDGAGNVCVTGYSYAVNTDYDFATIKYSTAGIQEWVSRYNGTGSFNDRAVAIVADDKFNFCVAGLSYGIGTGYDYAIVKYNSTGVQQWVARYDGPASGDDIPTSACTDDSGNMYVTGYSFGGESGYDFATVKYSRSGVLKWVRRYNGPADGFDAGRSICSDGNGHVYVTGESDAVGHFTDFATIKYDTAGRELWTQRFDGPSQDEDVPSALVVDSTGNIFVAGYSYRQGTLLDYATVKYDSSGVLQWAKFYNGPGNNQDAATGLAIDKLGNVYVTGSSYSQESSYDFATLQYNPSGNECWVERYTGPANYLDYSKSIVLDDSGNVYVGGYSEGGGWRVFTAVKYRQLPVSSINRRPGTEVSDGFELLPNYPNPFNATTTIRYRLQNAAKVRLSVFNPLGEEVARLVDRFRQPGEYAVKWDASDHPSGIYFYRIQYFNPKRPGAVAFQKTGKTVLIK